MTVTRTAIFIASRFGEFSLLRAALRERIDKMRGLSAIDLNDGAVTDRPPLEECLYYVRHSEIMILLLGDTYGSLAPGHDKSFTHLEYEEAIRDGSSTRVLVFCIGRSYENACIRYSTEEPRLAAWQRQVEANHTIGFIDPDRSPEDAAEEILRHLVRALHELTALRRADEAEEVSEETALTGEVPDGTLPDEATVEWLDERIAQRSARLPLDDSAILDQTAATLFPAAVAAREQRIEAARALELGELGVAIRHLRRALEFQPLNIEANYWLARLYVALDRKERALEAMELAERAARAAEGAGLLARTAASHIIAARAASLAGRTHEAIALVQEAQRVMPTYSKVHIELARHQVTAGQVDAALRAIQTAFEIYPPSLDEVLNDPAFDAAAQQIAALIDDIKGRIEERLRKVLGAEDRIARLAGTTPRYAANDLPRNPLAMINLGRASVQWQLSSLRSLLDRAAVEHYKYSIKQENSSLLNAWRSIPFKLRIGLSLIALMAMASIWVGLAILAGIMLAGILYSDSVAQKEVDKWNAVKTKACEALKLFECETLAAGSRFLPFPSLAGARQDGIVRATKDAIERWKEEHGGVVEVDDALPIWLGDIPPWHGILLYRVERLQKGLIRLSRQRVYFKA